MSTYDSGGTWDAGTSFDVPGTGSGGGGGGGGGVGRIPSPWLIVEVAFANNPLTPIASCTWTDITRYCQTLTTSIGRSHELTRIESGQLAVRLVNLDGRISPFNTSSPYHGPYTDGTDTTVAGLDPMKRIRVRAVWNSVTYPVWHGFIASWPQVWPNEKTAYVDVTATDALKLLNLRVLGTVYSETVNQDNPVLWYRFADAGNGLGYLVSTVPGPAPGDLGNLTLIGSLAGGFIMSAGPTLLVGDATTSASLTGSAQDQIHIPDLTVATSFSVECWFKTAVAGGAFAATPSGSWVLQFSGTGIRFSVTDGSAPTTLVTSGAVVAANSLPHHVAATYNSATSTVVVYFDGVAVGTVSGATTGQVAAGAVTIGNGFAGDLQDFAVYSTVLTAGQVATHF